MKCKKIKVLLCLTAALSALLGGCSFHEGSDLPANGKVVQESENSGDSQQKDENQEAESSSQAIQETESESQEPEPVVTTVTISATGDCTLGATQTHGYEGSFHEYYDKNGEEYFFAGVKEIFEEDDFTLVNLECVLTDETARVEKKWNLKGRPEYTGIMTSSSIEGCSLGNNHTLDYGEASLTDTMSALDEAGIVYGYNDQTGIYTTDEGVTIGIVSVGLFSEKEQREKDIQNGIASLREQGVDLVIVACHWGVELDHYPTQYQQEAAHRIIDWGADLVIGNHPHVLQGIEIYNGKVICYSLGNFCFGGNRNPSDKNTMIYQQTFTFVDCVLQDQVEAKIVPCTISSIDSRNDFQPTIAEDDRKASIIEKVQDYSEPYGEIVFEDDGTIMIEE